MLWRIVHVTRYGIYIHVYRYDIVTYHCIIPIDSEPGGIRAEEHSTRGLGRVHNLASETGKHTRCSGATRYGIPCTHYLV